MIRKSAWVEKGFVLVLVMVVAGIMASAGGVAAQGPPLDLKVDGSDDPSPYFEVGNVAPGSWGERDIVLSNEGTEEGAALIQIPGVIDDENGWIEPERDEDNTPDEGELSQYLRLRISADLDGNGSFEKLVADDFASELEGWEQFIGLIPAGSSITIKFRWSVDWQVGNIIQSDICIFDIMYILSELLPPTPEFSNLVVPEMGFVCEDVPISVDLRNVGHSTDTFLVTLNILQDTTTVYSETKSVTVEPFKRVTVDFSWHPDAEGEYMVTVGGLSDTITVVKAPELEYSNLVITPSPANVCDDVSISVEVHNIGGIGHTFTLTASVDGWSGSKTVTVEPCQTVTVDFSWHPTEPGTYTVTVGPLEGEVSVLTPPTPTPTAPPPRPGGGGGGGAPMRWRIAVDMWGKVTWGYRTTFGILVDTIEAVSEDGVVSLFLRQGTEVLDPQGEPIDRIWVEPEEEPPPLPPDAYVVAAYDFTPSCTFDPAVELTIGYGEQALPEGFEEVYLVIRYYREDEGWRELPTVVDTGANTVSALIGHCTVFAIVAPFPPPELTLTTLSVSPKEVKPGESVTIAVGVANPGAITGSRTVELWIEGKFEQSWEVTLNPGESEMVSFTVTRDEPGSYRAAVNGFREEFMVLAPPPFNWPLFGGIIGGLVLAAALAYLLWRRASAQPKEA